MHYLIDGHNLIGRMPDIGLADPHDEVELVLRLRSWSARSRKRRVTVVFDHGLPGGVDKALSTGKVRVVFAPSGNSADSILIERIRSVRNPGELTVITSDARILNVADKRRVPAIRSEDFVSSMRKGEQTTAGASEEVDPSIVEDRELSDAELAMWLDLFGDSDD